MALWSKLRLVRALREGGLDSGPTLLHQAFAVELLKIEAAAFKAAQKAGAPVSFQPLSDERLARMRAVALGAPGFLSPGVGPEVRAKALACLSWNKCAALYEAVSEAAMLGVVKAAPFDDLVSIASSECSDLTFLRGLRATLPLADAEARAMLLKEGGYGNLVRRYYVPRAGKP